MEIVDVINSHADIDLTAYKLSSLFSNSLAKFIVSYSLPKEKYNNWSANAVKALKVLNSQLKLYSGLIYLVSSNPDNKTLLELKLDYPVENAKFVRVYLKRCMFSVYDADKCSSYSYHCTSVEIDIDANGEDTDVVIDSEKGELAVLAPKMLSIYKPKFIKQVPTDRKLQSNCIIFRLEDIISVDVNNKKDLKKFSKHSPKYLGDSLDDPEYFNLIDVYSASKSKISLRKCILNEFKPSDFRFYLNNQVRTIEMVLTDDMFDRFLTMLKSVEYFNNINELNLSIGNSSYLHPLLTLLSK